MSNYFSVSLIIALLACAAPLTSAEENPGPDAGSKEANATYSAQQIADYVQQNLPVYVESIEKLSSILREITDKESAESSVDELGKCFSVLMEKERVLRDVTRHAASQADMENVVKQHQSELDRLEKARERSEGDILRLHQHECFESQELSAIISAISEECDIRLPEPKATAEQIALLSEMKEPLRKKLIAKYPTIVQGGPGFTPETAWVILDEEISAVSREYDILRDALNYPSPESQALQLDGDKAYDVHIIRVHLRGKPLLIEQWFDITRYWNKQRR